MRCIVYHPVIASMITPSARKVYFLRDVDNLVRCFNDCGVEFSVFDARSMPRPRLCSPNLNVKKAGLISIPEVKPACKASDNTIGSAVSKSVSSLDSDNFLILTILWAMAGTCDDNF